MNLNDYNKINYYEILNLELGEESQAQIKKNFLELNKIFHPDKGGNCVDLQKELINAYKVLSDPFHKIIYDRFGLQGLTLISDDPKLKCFEKILRNPTTTKEDIKKTKEILYERINKKINEKIEESQNSKESKYINNTDITNTVQVPLIEKFFQNEKIVNFWWRPKTSVMMTEFPIILDIYKFKQQINLEAKFYVQSEKKDGSEEYTLSFSRSQKMPFKLFDRDVCEIDHELNFSDGNFYYNPSLNLSNFLYNENTACSLSPKINISESEISELKVGISHSNKFFGTFLKYDLVNNGLSLNNVYNHSKKEKIIFTGTIEKKSVMLSGTFRYKISNSSNTTFSAHLLNNVFSLSNDYGFFLKGMNFEVKSSLNFIKNEKKQLSMRSVITFSFKIQRFKFNLPIIIGSLTSKVTILSLFFSSFVGISHKIITRLYKKYSKRNEFVNEKNRNLHFEFIEKNKNEAVIRQNDEKNNLGLIIEYAFFGEEDKIEEIYKSLSILGEYINDSKEVFDIKVALSLLIEERKLIIPIDITDLNGVYIPDFRSMNKLSYVIKYKYRLLANTVIFKNNKTVVKLPEYDN